MKKALSISSINSDITEIFNSIWTEVNLPPDLYPSLSSTISSDILIRLGQHLKKSPLELEKVFLKEESYFTTDRGYINLDLFNKEFCPDLFFNDCKPVHIFLPPLSTENIRLYAMGIFSFYLASFAGVECKISIGASEYSDFSFLPLKSFLSKKVDFLTYLEKVLSSFNGRALLFLSPESLDSNHYSSIYKRYFTATNHIICPPKVFLHGLDNEINNFLLEEENSLLDAVYYLCLKKDSQDLFLAEITLNQSEKFTWLRDSLLNRLSSSSIVKGKNVEAKNLFIEDSLSTKLALHNLYLKRVLTHGEILEYSANLSLLFSEFLYFFNSPNLRAEMERGELAIVDIAKISYMEQILQLFEMAFHARK